MWPGMYIFFFFAGYHAQGHDLKRFRTFCDTISTMALSSSDIGIGFLRALLVLISRCVIAAKGVLFTSEMTLDALIASVIHFTMIERLKKLCRTSCWYVPGRVVRMSSAILDQMEDILIISRCVIAALDILNTW